jgi:LPXTG-motif cell wall-anchored protein
MEVAVGPTLALYIGIVVVIIAAVWLVRRRR